MENQSDMPEKTRSFTLGWAPCSVPCLHGCLAWNEKIMRALREPTLLSYDFVTQTSSATSNHLELRYHFFFSGKARPFPLFRTSSPALLFSSLLWNVFFSIFNAPDWHSEFKRKRFTPPTQQSVCCHGSSWGSCMGHEMKDTSRLHTCARMRQRDVQIPSHPQVNQPRCRLWSSGSIYVAEFYTWTVLLNRRNGPKKKLFADLVWYGENDANVNHLLVLLIDGGEH